MIKIVTTNSGTDIWKEGEYTDYIYNGKAFVIINKGEWVGIYNMDHVVKVTVKE